MKQTAEEFIQDYLDVSNDFMDSMKEQLKQCSGFNFDNIPDFMIEFAKLHVQAALKAALNNVEYADGNNSAVDDIDEDSILNSYPLTKIK